MYFKNPAVFEPSTIRSVKHVKVGDRIRIDEQAYLVTSVYPNFIRAKGLNGNGKIEETSFNLGDLVVNNYEPKEPYYGFTFVKGGE